MSGTRSEGRSEAAAEPEPAAPAAATGRAGRRRPPAGAPAQRRRTAPSAGSCSARPRRHAGRLTKLQSLLDDDQEEAGDRADARAVRGRREEDARPAAPRKLAVKSFGDEEMARGIASLKGGTLQQKLRWMIAEDVTSFGLVWSMLVDKSVPAKEKTDLYSQNDIRAYFISLCNNDEMASVVDVLGGTSAAEAALDAARGHLVERGRQEAQRAAATASSARASTSSRR